MEKTTQYYLEDTDKLIPYARNARTHSEKQIAQIAASIKEFGFLSPIVISKDNTILCGHGRFYAAQKLGLKKVPCVKEEYLTEAQKRAYIIADNQLSLNAGWDEDLLSVELSDLQENAFDLSLLGFDEKDLAKLMDVDTEAENDDFDVEAELEKPCFSKPGDIWHLGRHTVICGDSTDKNTYTSLLGGKKVNLVCTDAPYFVNLQSASGKVTNDDLNDKDAYEFLMKAFTCMRESMADDASIYEFYATSKARIFHDAFEDAGFKVGAGLVWKKDRLVLTRTDWKYIHEPIIWGWKKKGKHIWYGDQKQVTVFEFPRIKSSKKEGYNHPDAKPVPLIAYLISQCTMTNSLVLDAFMGSGTTIVACEELGRIAYGIEIEPKFIDVEVMRYKKFMEDAGKDASDIYLLRDGKKLTLDEALAEMPSDLV
ncbi:MAG: site-specific DNA-methyltransferase [Eubacterium sp.]|jgi:DNA modification methylase|nr:site-specific DNA-methyltransferase [Eubacterium sp.]MCH4078595.1 site-specific DNA-methyltransferase [Eubacterium sp.]MCH4109736.1 site-specific DNA-methyltransferase [Eubacterium sp.]